MSEGKFIPTYDLPGLLALLQKHGVRRYQESPLVIEFAPPPAPEAKPMTAADLKALTEDDSAKCVCGHAEWQHTNGLCVVGCEAEKCIPEEAKQ